MRFTSIRLSALSFIIASLFVSCKKFLDVGYPPDKIVPEYIYSSNKSAANVLTGLYYDMQLGGSLAHGRYSFSVQLGLQADEIAALPGSFLNGQYRNIFRYDFWTTLYKLIYRANAALEGLTASTSLSPDVKNQLLGEAYFLRAFYYFYLVNLYGDVPLILNSDYKSNSNASRTPMADVYNKMVGDLKLAEQLLSDNYLAPNAASVVDDRLRPTKAVATAMLARVYLYQKNWKDAAAEASKVIDNKAVYDTVALDQVFLMNSKEAIWQLQPNYEEGTFNNTLDADVFVLINGPNPFQKPVVVADFLLEAFEKGDQRRQHWIGVNHASNGTTYYYPFKYKVYEPDVDRAEYIMVMRLAEQYLIRAEARAELNDIKGAQDDLNTVRSRAGLPDTDASDKTALVKAILHERQIELFSEWGHRWLDLKRTGTVDDVMGKITPLKGGTWESYKQLFDIPVSEFKYNGNLVQNTGYPSR
ncbi:RagB/SusD family nutrient uptake outer membrane protein [Chitinophaga pinensis]|uniref:RagB/SusD domain protein n=1 Tax=Chitinophaga pinensis (strain ATCC 43595 / DSM 2588 / LMG 13176 / NBRC 15968 / NCIMB 11800 / UQM 2034) TaxID=485918 RepID=A0A979G4H1_CHIPD|nr:RagB/SusD family nutrient uptake outer membrane protein [Chitinophaga pinensis]ACU60662.1 RagB/SusD domain protein [Chitinophaga pinensis DSM 2588]